MLYRVEAKTPASRRGADPNPPARPPHSTPSHGVNIRPDQKEVWMVDGVYGYVYVYDITSMPPRHVADVPLFRDPSEQPHPGWMSFSLDGKVRLSGRRRGDRHGDEESVPRGFRPAKN